METSTSHDSINGNKLPLRLSRITEDLEEIDINTVQQLFPGTDPWRISCPQGGIDLLLGIGEAIVYPCYVHDCVEFLESLNSFQ